MNIIKILKSYLLVAFIATHSLAAHSFESSAKQAYLADFATNQVMYEKNAHSKMAPSSMTKILTAYITFDYIKQGKVDLNDTVKVSANARQMEGSRMFLELGSTVTIEELLHGLIVQSGNDAAVALAEKLAGSEEQFVQIMNEYVNKLNLKNTNFANSSGLNQENHYSSAYDIYLISKSLISKFPGLYSIFTTEQYTHNNITQPNRNLLLGTLGVDGIKTGHTDAGGYGISLSAKNKNTGQRVIGVINGLESEQQRHVSGLELISHAFNDFTHKTIVESDDQRFERMIEVRYGKRNKVKAAVAEPIKIYVEKSKSNQYQINSKHFDKVTAPVEAGDTLGQIVVIDEDGIEVAKTDLIAKESVPKAGLLKRIHLNTLYLIEKTGWFDSKSE